jgi:putative redox protein
MIQTNSQPTPFQVQFTNERNSALADTTQDKGGGDSGFRPHELLEAALATCMNKMATMYATKHGIPLSQVVTKVSLDRSGSEQVVFKYVLELKGDLTNEQRKAINSAVLVCPVRKTLSRGFKFMD